MTQSTHAADLLAIEDLFIELQGISAGLVIFSDDCYESSSELTPETTGDAISSIAKHIDRIIKSFYQMIERERTQ